MTREWVIELPAGTPLLTANNRMHWAPRNARTQALRSMMILLATQLRVPAIEYADVLVEYEPPPGRRADRHPMASQRITDSDGLWPTAKALLDGAVDAGIFATDTTAHVRQSTCRVLSRTHPRGQLRVRIIVLAGEEAA